MVDLINISRDAPKEPAAFLLLKKARFIRLALFDLFLEVFLSDKFDKSIIKLWRNDR